MEEVPRIYKINDQAKLRTYYQTIPLDSLKSLMIYLDDLYYNTGESVIADWKYDILVEEISKLDPNFTVKVGAPLREDEIKVKLPFNMGSLDTYYPEDTKEIQKWFTLNPAREYVVSDKLDGISCLLQYARGKYKLYTRGDGITGSDISYVARYIRYIPSSLNVSSIYVRGELVIAKRDFAKYSKEYKNPRNMVTGMVKAKTAREGLSDVGLVVYEILGKGEMPSPIQQFQTLRQLGFRVVRHKTFPQLNIPILERLSAEYKENSPYEIDGIVVQSNKPYIRNTSGNPSYQFAFKMRTFTETVVEEVKWNISKHGLLKPRIRIQPIELSGATITYATGFNADFIESNQIGPGTVVTITRSGEVIPYITEVIQATEAQMPDVPYHWDRNHVDIIADVVGKEMCIKVITHFFSTLKIKFVSDATVKALYDSGLNSLLKIVEASEEDFMKANQVKKRSAERIYNNIHNRLEEGVYLSQLMAGSSLFGFGLGVKKMDALMTAIPDLLETYSQYTEEELLEAIMEVEGFSTKSATKVVRNLSWFEQFLERLEPYVTLLEKKKVSSKLEGMVFVFTGARNKDLERQIESMGGKVTGSVTSKTSALIIAEGAPRRGKAEKAEDLGIPIYTHNEFRKKFKL